MSIYDSFVKAIQEKSIVLVEFNSNEKGIIQRKCIPYDFGPSRKFKDGQIRYHFHDLDSPTGSHNLSILPSQVISIQILDDHFHPKDYIHWQPNWHLKRDWGEFS